MDDSFCDPKFESNKLGSNVEAIVMLPIKNASFRDKVSCGRKKKTKCIKIDNEDMVAEAFRISTKELQPKI